MISFSYYRFLCLFLGTTDYFERYDYAAFLYEVLSRYVSYPYSALMIRNLIMHTSFMLAFYVRHQTKSKGRNKWNGNQKLISKHFSNFNCGFHAGTPYTKIVPRKQFNLARFARAPGVSSEIPSMFQDCPEDSCEELRIWSESRYCPFFRIGAFIFSSLPPFPRFLTGDRQNTNHYPDQTQEID